MNTPKTIFNKIHNQIYLTKIKHNKVYFNKITKNYIKIFFKMKNKDIYLLKIITNNNK